MHNTYKDALNKHKIMYITPDNNMYDCLKH